MDQKAIIERRRRVVAGLLLRQRMSQRRIQHVLSQTEENRNPQTGEPWSAGTIAGDIKALKKQWRQAAAEDIDAHFVQVLAELEEISTQAWTDKDHQLALSALRTKIELLGLKAPTRHEITGKDGAPVTIMTRQEYAELASTQMNALGSQFAAIESAYE
jgi:hypothetical protein